MSLTCGNGSIELPEECDDGNRNDGDVCSSECFLERGFCGDGIVQSLLGEQCEQSVPSPVTCTNICRYLLLSCGDGRVDPGEACDLGTSQNSNLPNAACRPDCSAPRCGDRIVDPGESCDDGNRVAIDGCSASCQIERQAPQDPNTLPAQIIDLPIVASCANATQCASNFCRNGQCAQCASNAECGGAQYCLNGRCEVAGCAIDAQCQSGQRCVQGSCVLPQIAGAPCVTDGQCGSGGRCFNGACNLPGVNTLPANVTPGATPPGTTDSGPGALVLMAAGAAAGYAWMRRRRA